MLSFVAEQIDVLPCSFDDYLAAERTRQRHAAELQDRLISGCIPSVRVLRLNLPIGYCRMRLGTIDWFSSLGW